VKKITIVITLLFTLSAISCSKHQESNANVPVATPTPTTLTALLPEIKTFLDKHKELGKPEKSQTPTDWAKGKKQRVILDDKRDLTFYTQSGVVVTVYEEARDGRKTIWGDPIKLD
jgi:hypothetical protein